MHHVSLMSPTPASSPLYSQYRKTTQCSQIVLLRKRFWKLNLIFRCMLYLDDKIKGLPNSATDGSCAQREPG